MATQRQVAPPDPRSTWVWSLPMLLYSMTAYLQNWKHGGQRLNRGAYLPGMIFLIRAGLM